MEHAITERAVANAEATMINVRRDAKKLICIYVLTMKLICMLKCVFGYEQCICVKVFSSCSRMAMGSSCALSTTQLTHVGIRPTCVWPNSISKPRWCVEMTCDFSPILPI